MLTYKNSAKYKLIKDYNVPENEYLSIITDAYETNTLAGIPVLDICYMICNSVLAINHFRGKLPKEKLQRYYVKERIPVDSIYMDDFMDMLYNKYSFPESFEPSDLVGLTELFRVRYNSKDFGEIYNRKEWTDEDTEAYIQYLEEKEAALELEYEE